MPIISIIFAVAVVFLLIYVLLNRPAADQAREGVVNEVLSKDALVVDFGDGKRTVVKLFGIAPASESEMLDDKIYAFYEEHLRGRRVLAKQRSVGAGEIVVAELRTPAGEYVNAVLVGRGFARWTPSEAASDTELAEAQERARAEQLGVWNPAVQQLAEERRRQLAAEQLTDDEIANLTIDPEDPDSQRRS